MAENIALIAGATGAAAMRLVELLGATPGWQVVGLCRNPPAEPWPANIRYISTDLTDVASVRAAVAASGAVTHMAYASRAPFGEGGVEDVPGNVVLLANVLEAVDTPALKHVHLVEGAKWYGMHIGKFRTPALEDDARHLPPNFYYDQQDMIVARQQGKAWTWSASRPSFVVDFAPDRSRNLISTLGVYAAICKELNTDFDFPGRAGAYDTLMELTDATQLARSIRWMFTDPRAANQAFNVTNGDVFRYSRLWPRLARYFGLNCGTVRPMQMARWMADKEPVWQRIVARHGLIAQPMDNIARWDFLDFALGLDRDVFMSMNRARLAGFNDLDDTETMFYRHLDTYRAARILP
jgi:nucleoside-diphosphate-sugar epimerase